MHTDTRPYEKVSKLLDTENTSPSRAMSTEKLVVNF